MATLAPSTRTTTIVLASASAGPFLIGYRLFEAGSLSVLVNNLPRTDWTLASAFLNGYDDNASITFTSSLAIADVLQIDGDLVPRRGEDYLPSDPGLTRKINIELPRIWSVLQELTRKASRAVRSTSAIEAFVPEAGSTIIFDDDLNPQPGPTADEISGAQGYATAAAGSAVEALASATEAAAYGLKHFNTMTDFLDSVVPLTAGVVVQVKDNGGEYRALASDVGADFQRDDGQYFVAHYIPANPGPDWLKPTATAAQMIAAPAYIANRDKVVRATDIGVKTGSTYADANVTRLNDAIAGLNSGDITSLEFGAGSYYLADSLDNWYGSNSKIVGLGRGLSHIILDPTTGSHQGQFIKIGGFADVFTFTATAGQTVFTGAAAEGTLAFVTTGSITVLIAGVDQDFTANVGAQSVTLTTPAALGDLVRIQVAAFNMANARLEGLRFSTQSGGADSTMHLFNMGAIGNFSLLDLRPESSLGGFLRCGYEGNIGNLTMRDVLGGFNPAVGNTIVDCAGAGNLYMTRVQLFGSRGLGPLAAPLMRFKPLTGQVIDTVRMDYVQCYAFDGANYNVMLDAENGAVTNFWANFCTFDRGLIYNIFIKDTAAVGARWMRNFVMENCYMRLAQSGYVATARNVDVAITGDNTRLDNLQIKGGVCGFAEQASMRLVCSGVGSSTNGVLIQGVQFAHQNSDAGLTPVPACVDIAMNNVQLKNCMVGPAFQASVPRVNYLARITADVDNFNISMNDNAAALVSDVSQFATYAAHSPRRIARDNAKSGSVFGFRTGMATGGSVTQATSKTTTVVLDRPCGQIITHAASLAAGASVIFTLTDSYIKATDVILANVATGSGTYTLTVGAHAAGSCTFTLKNITAGALAEAVTINFGIITSSAT